MSRPTGTSKRCGSSPSIDMSTGTSVTPSGAAPSSVIVQGQRRPPRRGWRRPGRCRSQRRSQSPSRPVCSRCSGAGRSGARRHRAAARPTAGSPRRRGRAADRPAPRTTPISVPRLSGASPTVMRRTSVLSRAPAGRRARRRPPWSRRAVGKPLAGAFVLDQQDDVAQRVAVLLLVGRDRTARRSAPAPQAPQRPARSPRRAASAIPASGQHRQPGDQPPGQQRVEDHGSRSLAQPVQKRGHMHLVGLVVALSAHASRG